MHDEPPDAPTSEQHAELLEEHQLELHSHLGGSRSRARQRGSSSAADERRTEAPPAQLER